MTTDPRPSNAPFHVQVLRGADWAPYAEFLTLPAARECARCGTGTLRVVHCTGGPLGPERPHPAAPIAPTDPRSTRAWVNTMNRSQYERHHRRSP